MALNVITPAVSLDIAALPRELIEALYVHVPFCVHKCHYCDFYSITGQGEDRMSGYVDRLLQEADRWSDLPLRPRTVFIGGGTPSLLPVRLMNRLLAGLHARIDLSGVREWTMEVNPATSREASFDADYAAMLHQHGVNRLSMGAQSFDEAELAVLERHHRPQDLPRTLDLARGAGFERLSIDLIFALPGQSLEGWAANLERGISLGTQHISCYALTYEPNTPMTFRMRRGEFAPAEDELEIRMLRYTRDRLHAAGLPAYEVSNFGVPCEHNMVYWRGGNYAALGPAASGHVGGVRWKNHPSLGRWERALDADTSTAAEIETLSPAQRASELAMLNLRLTDGIDLAAFTRATGDDPRSHWAMLIGDLTEHDLIEITPTHLRVTARGLPILDAIAAKFLE